MKKVSIYNSDFNKHGDWKDLLEELGYSTEERETIEEVELTVSSSEILDSDIDGKLY